MKIKVNKKSVRDKMDIRNNYFPIVTIPKSKIKKIVRIIGFGLIIIGVTTWFIPLTTAPLLICGLGCLGLTRTRIKHYRFITTWKLRKGVITRELKTKLLLRRGSK